MGGTVWNVQRHSFITNPRSALEKLGAEGTKTLQWISVILVRGLGIEPRYGLESPGIECRWGARFSTIAKTDSAAYTAFLFPGGKAAGAWR
jgi:hypothetical protein